MNKQSVMPILLLSCILFLCCYCAPQKQGKQKSSVTESNQQENREKVLIAELRQLYDTAKSQYERRAVCLRAIDEGAIHRGGHVSAIDEIFSTHFASRMPTEKEAIRKTWILFADQFSPPPAPDGQVTEGVATVGWYMAFDYDKNGAIQNYYLTNLHKGNISSVTEKKTVSGAELRRLYESAKSEYERRAVCLRAIDEGTIRSGARVSVIDEIFGTRFASDLPTRKEALRSASIDFTPSVSSPDKSQAAANVGWFLVVDYAYDGNIEGYYLTNLHK